MDSAPGPSPSRRTFDYPKPETGLTEWTSKIKAMQRQVDADEEAEQKRLEEEIAASRLARLRRSRGTGYGTHSDSLDLSTTKLNIPAQENDLTSTDVSRTTVERNNNQDDALRKLMGGSAKPTPTLASSIPPRTQASKPEPVSLAAFMGGRATGPRLNRHAPQQDAHDPTQFDQPNITAPHPIFGRGGVAMPGMASKRAATSHTVDHSDSVERYRPSSAKESLPPVMQRYGNRIEERSVSPQRTETRERTTSIPAVAKKYAERLEERPISPQKTGNRERTMSTPNYISSVAARTESLQVGDSRPTSNVTPRTFSRSPAPEIRPTTPASERVTPPISSVTSRPFSRSPAPEIRAKTPTSERFTPPISNVTSRPFSRSPAPEIRTTTPASERSTPATSIPMNYTPQASFMISAARPVTPLQTKQHSPPLTTSLQTKRSSPSLASSPQKSSITTPSLARPIRPEPRPSSQSPQVPASVVPSPAFQKPPPPKDLTPSISRLQGRGFVQNVVRASSQLEASSQSAPVSPEKPRPSGRKSSVLDRWQPNAGVSTSPTPSPTYAHSFPVRRSVTVDPSIASAATQNASQKPPPPPKPLKSMVSLPSMQVDSAPKPAPLSPRKSTMLDNTPPQHDPGLGSATTVMFFKPEKTDDSPSELPMVDELGVKRDMNSSSGMGKPQSHESANLPLPSGKPLIHPTKDRARKPKRNKDSHGQERPSRTDLAVPHTPQASTQPLSTPHSARHISSAGNTSVVAPPTQPRSPLPFRSSTAETTPSAPNVAWLTEKWGSSAPIGVASSPSPRSPPAVAQKPSNGMIRRALPGMVAGGGLPNKSAPEADPASVRQGLHTRALPSPKGPTPAPNSDSTVTGSSADSRQEERASKVASPTPKHIRIPSTGNRATVMDVAQAMSDHSHAAVQETGATLEKDPPKELEESQLEISNDVRSRSPGILSSAAQAERRKSSYEKYSAIILPSLKEEATPTSTPAGTLSRSAAPAAAGSNDTSGRGGITSMNTTKTSSKRITRDSDSDVVHFDHEDLSVPKIDVDALLSIRDKLPTVSEEQTLQVEVIAIIGTTATSLSQNTDIFYDNEILAIVHRSKSKSTGLASSMVWGWLGKGSHFEEREERKLKEIAKRYGTTPAIVHQYSEPSRLVHVLGGQLTIRQGSRAHWTAENTSMYLIRSSSGVIFIDEHDLNIRNLCSAFSYCVSILDSVYVWHGCGSTSLERQAALWYAQSLIRNDASPVELNEGENDDDEMFWMILGDDSYANADYWRWRRTSPLTDPNIWKVDASLGNKPITSVESFSQEKDVFASVYIIDCIWELFVMVGRDARGNRLAIKLGIEIATHLSQKIASARPYPPTVHVLVLPSQLPLDLLLNIRDLDEVSLNDNDVPDHMNLLPASDALGHLHKRSWEKAALKDKTMLPVGLTVTDTHHL